MNTNIRSRVVTALVGLPLLIFIIGWGRPGHFSLLVFAVTAIALWEYFLMVFPGRRRERFFGIALGGVVALGIIVPTPFDPGLLLSGVLIVAFSTHLFFGGNLAERYQRLGWTLLGTLYIGFLMPHLALLFNSSYGREWVFFILLVIMSGDSAGYFVGSSWGKRRLYPEISPAKTIEGALGSITASALSGIIGGKFLLPGIPWLELLLLSLIINVLGQTGDLFESWIKRVFSIKDSGNLLPGHGGLLDRLDSLIFPAVFTTYYLRLFHP